VEFDKRFEYVEPYTENRLLTATIKYFSRFTRPFTSLHLFWTTLFSFVPILHWLPRYDIKNNLLNDVVGGVMVGIMHVPQGIAYAFLAGVHPVVGLYTSFFPVLTYMLFGNSRHNSLGSFAVVALMSGRTVYRLSHKSENISTMVSNTSAATEPSFQAIEVASALTLAIGLVQLMIAVLGLDFLTTYFSEQIVAGFTTGAAVHVFVTQLKDITGIYGTPRRDGIGNAMLVRGRLPLPSLPRFAILPHLIKEAVPIAIVIVAVHISMAKLLAKQNNYSIDSKQEVYAIGFTSSIASLFPVYPNSCSLARTMVNASAGTKTQ
ncbi:inorganic anion transporter, SulP family, partial [Ostertagia ostertagi]